MNHPEQQYLNTLKEIIHDGEKVSNRTGVDTLRLLGVTHRYDFKNGFPLLTTKKVYWKGIVHELLWFLSGSPNIKYLLDNDVNIWNGDCYREARKHDQRQGAAWMPEFRVPDTEKEFIEKLKTNEEYCKIHGNLGPVYGVQWRRWNYSVDQIAKLVDGLIFNPSARRHIVTAWNPAEIDQMALPPCHVLSQYTVTNDNKLWCHMYQRSCDMFLGVPFNIASYSLLTYMLAHITGLQPGGFIHTMHDCHLYSNHLDAAVQQIVRTPKQFPQVILNPEIKVIDDFKFEDIQLIGYDSYPSIKADLVT